MSTQGTRSPIEMIWTAKNVPFLFRMFLVQRLGKDDLGGSRPILPGGGERHPARDPHPGAARLLSDGEVCDRGWTKELVAGRERPFWCCFGPFWGPRGPMNRPHGGPI